MKIQLIALSLLLLIGCQSKRNVPGQENAITFFVGTYTDGASEGIYACSLRGDGTLEYIGLASRSDNPSYLAFSAGKRFLVAVNETDEGGTGTVESYAVKGDSLLLLSRSPSGGAHPCFVSMNAAGFVLVANYTGGNAGLLRLDSLGLLTPLLDVQQHSGSGTTERQKAPHAHSAWFVPGSTGVISVDLGTNGLWFSRLDTTLQKLQPSAPPTLKMAPGAGPRHLAFHPNGRWTYVVNELNATVTLVKTSTESLTVADTSFTTLPDGFTGDNYCADIHLTSDGKFLYVSNRGHNSLAIFAINSHNGSLLPLGHQTTHGDWPRNFALSPEEDYLVVANQRTNKLVSFRRDRSTGMLTYIHRLDVPTPVCVLF